MLFGGIAGAFAACISLLTKGSFTQSARYLPDGRLNRRLNFISALPGKLGILPLYRARRLDRSGRVARCRLCTLKVSSHKTSHGSSSCLHQSHPTLEARIGQLVVWTARSANVRTDRSNCRHYQRPVDLRHTCSKGY